MAIEYRTEPEYWEYLDGEVHPKVSPRQRHAVVQLALAEIIKKCGRGHGQTGTEWDVWLPDREKLTKFIPDVSFFAFERLRAMSDEDRQFPPCAPDIAVEVLSPGDSKTYLEQKVALYLTHGSVVVLDVDPLERVVVAHRRSGAQQLLRISDRFIHPDLPWLTFEIRDVFADLDIPDPSTSSG